MRTRKRRLIYGSLAALAGCGLGWIGAFFSLADAGIAAVALVIYGSLLAGLIHLGGRMTRGLRVKRMLARGFHGMALESLHLWGRDEALLAALRHRVPFPSTMVRGRMTTVVQELLALRKAAADRSNPHIPETLRKEIAHRSRELLLSLWPKCQDLALLSRPGMEADAVEARVSEITAPLKDLAEMLAATRQQLMHATLQGSDLELHHELEHAGAMKWQVAEMPRMQEMVEG